MSPVKKYRPTSELDLPKPEKQEHAVEERTHIPNEGQNELLAALGHRIAPDGYDYVGSYACHVYTHPLKPELSYLTHHINLDKVPETGIIQSLKEMGRKLMSYYGHKAPKKRSDKPDVDLTRN